MKHLPILLSALLLFGCVEPPTDPNAPDPSLDPVPIGGDAGGDCAHPEEGCACDQAVPIDCYLPPIEREDGSLECQAGVRYCRDGLWSGCDSIHRYELVGTATSLVTGPTSCNPCDPACAVSRDVPSGADLPGRGTRLEYDPAAGGIRLEGGGTGSTMLPDSDGDGVPDVADDCVGPGAYRDAAGSCSGATTFFFHDLPYGGPAEVDPLDINVQIRTADVYFLMDTTGSMYGEISNLQAGLTSGTYISGCSGGIIGAIRCTIPDAWFGVGNHDDYPYGSYGSPGDVVYRNYQDITSSLSAAQTAVNSLPRHYGNDGPESQTQALWAIATGGGLGPYLASRTGCPAGRWGYPCFRDGTIPIVILFTDAPHHNGPYGYNYSFSGGGGPAPGLPTPTFVSGNETFGSARNTGNASTTWTGWSGNTCSHANNISSPSCGAAGSSAEVAFVFTVTAARTITISLEGSSYDTVLSIHNAATGEIACNDDAIGLMSRIDIFLGAGTYYAVVGGYAGQCGAYRMSIGNPSAGPVPPATSYPVSWPTVVSALNARSIRVITVHSGGSYGLADANALADATGSYSSSGSRYVFPIGWDGSGLSSAVVNAVVDLANYNRMDVSARATDDAGTAIDERGFVDAITAVGWGPGSCQSISGGSTFIQCLPGTSLDFSIAFRNDIVMPTAVPQVFNFFIEVIGDGVFVLQRVPVRIVVPPNVPLYPPDGSYFRDYDSTLYCAPNERPDWGDLTWQIVSLPTGTSIRWELRAATTLAALASATPVTFTTPTRMPPVDIAAALNAAGIPNLIPYLRVTAVLRASADRTQTPILRSFEVQYTCVPVE